jgi:CBS domain containing-hemolysin-like protein
MNPAIDWIVYATTALVVGVLSGAYHALEIISLGWAGEGDADDETDRVAGWFFSEPARNGAALAAARAVAAAALLVVSVRIGLDWFGAFAGALALSAFVGASLILPDLVARMFAYRDPAGLLHAVRPVAAAAVYVFRPAAEAARRLALATFPRAVDSTAFRLAPLRQKIELFGRQNGEETDEDQLVSSVLEFGETRVREVMVPRIDVVGLDADVETEEAVRKVVEAGHSRYPVFEGAPDRIVGTLHAKDLLRKISEGEDCSLRELMREAFFVPESKRIDEMLAEFKTRRQHLAVVVDEYGGTAGIVTLEDVLEEIVGDIQDEFDTEEALVQRVDDDTVLVDARVRLDELGEELGLELPEEAADSLGGLLYDAIGHVPEVGETWRFGGLVFEVQSVERQRIERVAVRGLASRRREAGDHTG